MPTIVTKKTGMRRSLGRKRFTTKGALGKAYSRSRWNESVRRKPRA